MPKTKLIEDILGGIEVPGGAATGQAASNIMKGMGGGPPEMMGPPGMGPPGTPLPPPPVGLPPPAAGGINTDFVIEAIKNLLDSMKGDLPPGGAGSPGGPGLDAMLASLGGPPPPGLAPPGPSGMLPGPPPGPRI